MIENLIVIGTIVILFTIIVMAIFVLLTKPGVNSDLSKHVVYYFKPDNISPKLTELIEYNKSLSKKVKYDIKRD